MIKRIIVSMFFIDLLIALAIAIYWASHDPVIQPHTIKLGSDFLAFLRQCNQELNEVKIEIPTIPQEGFLSNIVKVGLLSNPFLALLNAFVLPIDMIMRFVNLLIQFLNTIVGILQFIIIVVKNSVVLTESLETQSSSSSSAEMLRFVC